MVKKVLLWNNRGNTVTRAARNIMVFTLLLLLASLFMLSCRRDGDLNGTWTWNDVIGGYEGNTNEEISGVASFDFSGNQYTYVADTLRQDENQESESGYMYTYSDRGAREEIATRNEINNATLVRSGQYYSIYQISTNGTFSLSPDNDRIEFVRSDGSISIYGFRRTENTFEIEKYGYWIRFTLQR